MVWIWKMNQKSIFLNDVNALVSSIYLDTDLCDLVFFLGFDFFSVVRGLAARPSAPIRYPIRSWCRPRCPESDWQTNEIHNSFDAD